MDLDAWLAQDLTSDETKEAYAYFMRPEPKDVRSDLQVDEETGQRFRLMSIGMVRNASEDQKKVVKVYIDPLPHIRIKDAKPLQGWYKGKTEDKGVRPRPCFTDAMLTEPYGGFCAVGCAFCVSGDTPVLTPSGPRPIADRVEVDLVWGRTPEGLGAAKVVGTMSRIVPRFYRVQVGQGTLTVTGNHPVFVVGRGWTPVEELRVGDRVETLQALLEFDGGALAPVLHGAGVPARGQGFAPGRQYAREEEPRAPEERGDAAEDARGVRPPPAEPRQGSAEVGRMEGSPRRAESTRDYRLPALDADAVHIPRREGGDLSVNRGASHRAVVRQDRGPLGVRAPGASGGGGLVTAGLLASGRGDLRGGEGVLPAGPTSAYRAAEQGLPDRGLGGREAPVVGGSVVEAIEVVEQQLTVYDIQTTSQNFYAGDGLLIHNCYVNSGFRGYRGTGLISVPMNYGDQVRSMLRKMKTSAAGYFSSFTDPFLPLEDVYHNTQSGAEAFVAEGLPIFFLSRLKYPEWAKDLLTRSKYSYAQKSINVANERDWRLLSPGAATLATHMGDIRELRARGVYVSIQVNPIVPGVVTHDNVEATFEMLAAAGANHVIVKFVEAGYSWAPAMAERIIKRFGKERGKVFEALFTQNLGGQRTIAEDYRMEGHIRYKRAATRLGMTYATCYEYRTEYDAKGKPLNKVGVSVGRDFTTADQCHGQRVPMFSREDVRVPFREVEECPPTGCLYCADEAPGGEARCGSEVFGAAPALRHEHFKQGVHDKTTGRRRLPLVP